MAFEVCPELISALATLGSGLRVRGKAASLDFFFFLSAPRVYLFLVTCLGKMGTDCLGVNPFYHEKVPYFSLLFFCPVGPFYNN